MYINRYIQKAQLLISISFVSLLPIDFKLLPILIGLLVLVGVLGYNKQVFIGNFKKYKFYFLFFILFYLLQTISLLWTNDTEKGLKDIEHKAFYIIAPLIFLLFKEWKTKWIIKSFVLSNFLICLYSFLNLIPFFIYDKWYFIEKTSNQGITLDTFRYISYHAGANFITFDVHRLYFCFSVITSLLFIVFNKKYFTNKLLKNTMIIFFVIVILILQSKISLLLFFVLTFYYLVNLFKSAKPKKILVISLLLAVIIGLSIYLNKTRFNQFINQLNTISMVKEGSFIERIQLSKCAIELIKESPIIGYGSGDIDFEIKKKLIKYKYTFLLENETFDPHNEFLKAQLGMGILGLIFFITIFASILYSAFVNSEMLLFFYFSFILIICFIEPFLSRQAGILPTLFFLGVLVNKNYQTENVKVN